MLTPAQYGRGATSARPGAWRRMPAPGAGLLVLGSSTCGGNAPPTRAFGPALLRSSSPWARCLQACLAALPSSAFGRSPPPRRAALAGIPPSSARPSWSTGPPRGGCPSR
eukprot:4628667-Alexandrium_andersonii.AAC.1